MVLRARVRWWSFTKSTHLSVAHAGNARSVLKSRRPALTLEASSVSSPGSKIGISPRRSPATLSASLSTPGDLVAEIGEAGTGNQADIARANQANSHKRPAL